MGVLLFVRRLLRLCLIWFRRSVTSFIPWLLSIMTNYSVTGYSVKMGNDNSSGSSVDREKDFDSTWEYEEGIPHDGEDESGARGLFKAYRNMRAAEDMQTFRRMYRKAVSKTDGDDDDDDSVHEKNFLPNLHFYQNKRPCDPDDLYIDEIHKEWYGDYDKLEHVHSYIQWLFPTQEHGMNFASYVLSRKEIRLFRKQEEVQKRLLKSYKLMLDFYGIQLLSEETGEVKRAKNCEERFKNLNRNTHNNLRITRILKSLGLLGFEHYQAPLVQFFLQETLKEKTLPRVKQSVLDYFMFSVLNKEEQKGLIRFAFQNFEPKYNFVWCPRRIQLKFARETRRALYETENDESNNVCVSSESLKNNLVHTEKQNDNEPQRDNQPQGIQSKDDPVNSAEQNDCESQRAQPQEIQSRNDSVNSAEQNDSENQRAQPQDIQSRNDENLSDGCQGDGGKSQRTDEDSKQEEGLGEGNGTPHVHEEGHENEVNYSSKPNGNMSKDSPVVQKNGSEADDDGITNTDRNLSEQKSGPFTEKPEVKKSSEQTEKAAVSIDALNNQTTEADVQQQSNSSNDHKMEDKTSGSVDGTNCELVTHNKSDHSAHDGPVIQKTGTEATTSESGTNPAKTSANTDKTSEQEKSDGQTVVTIEPSNDRNANENFQQTQETKSNKIAFEQQRSDTTTGTEFRLDPDNQDDESQSQAKPTARVRVAEDKTCVRTGVEMSDGATSDEQASDNFQQATNQSSVTPGSSNDRDCA